MSSVVKHMVRKPPSAATAATRTDSAAERSRLQQLHRDFAPRAVAQKWRDSEATEEQVLERLTLPPLASAPTATRSGRRIGAKKLLQWLSSFPGDSWQARWIASGVEEHGGTAWTDMPLQWLRDNGLHRTHDRKHLASGLLTLLALDVVRPGLRWMLTRAHPNLAPMMAQIRDPSGFGKLDQLAAAEPLTSRGDARIASTRIAMLLAAKGGLIADITVGDCVQLIDTMSQVHTRGGQKKIDFYLRLRALGGFPETAPHSIRAFGLAGGQLTVEQLVDRYPIHCRPVRDLIVEYLREREPALDFASVNSLSRTLAGLFWTRIEALAPGIDTLALPKDIVRAWKHELSTVTRNVLNEQGERTTSVAPRRNYRDALLGVRAFYMDLAHWAVEEPDRWAIWVAPCPVNDAEVKTAKDRKHRKSRMDQRTRERLAALPQLVRSVNDRRQSAAALLSTAAATQPGAVIDGSEGSLIRISSPTENGRIVWALDVRADKRRNLTYEEEEAFWAFATVEVLRLTGIRHEELLELSHHSITEYRLPSTGELIPLLQIAPSKTDVERMLLVSPELADVLSAIIQRSRRPDGSLPLVASYDRLEKVWSQPMPLLFQRTIGNEHRAISSPFIRKLLINALTATGLTDAAGSPLHFQPHDFRRIFITDAIMNGLPPHIAQVIAGHKSIDTTMGYKAVYPAETIEAHRAFISRRRSIRPSEEYRTPTDDEWDAFLAHFEKRKVSVGTCARAFGTPCIHEHACVRCALLRPDPNQRDRLVEIRDNLEDRIIEAKREGWLGEVEGLQVSYRGVKDKIAEVDATLQRRGERTNLGIPTAEPRR